jgi:hypothetical protein
VMTNRPFIATVLFVLAINHKHMLMYYAPAFFCTMLGACFASPAVAPAAHSRKQGMQEGTPAAVRAPGRSFVMAGVARVALLSATVVATFAVVWAPFLATPRVALQVRCPLECAIPIDFDLLRCSCCRRPAFTSPVFCASKCGPWELVDPVHQQSQKLQQTPCKQARPAVCSANNMRLVEAGAAAPRATAQGPF